MDGSGFTPDTLAAGLGLGPGLPCLSQQKTVTLSREMKCFLQTTKTYLHSQEHRGVLGPGRGAHPTREAPSDWEPNAEGWLCSARYWLNCFRQTIKHLGASISSSTDWGGNTIATGLWGGSKEIRDVK